MRVITGEARGRRLQEPKGNLIRPTTEKVKEALFSIIQLDVPGSRVLDLFAGTGQLGIEALSRGAESATFIDQSRDAVRLIKENLERTGLKNGRVVQAESLSFLESGEKYDIIFLDPPYDGNLQENAILSILRFDKLRGHGIIACESKADKQMLEVEAPYEKLREYRYGSMKLTIYRRKGNNDE